MMRSRMALRSAEVNFQRERLRVFMRRSVATACASSCSRKRPCNGADDLNTPSIMSNR